jgi:hypothetical protein
MAKIVKAMAVSLSEKNSKNNDYAIRAWNHLLVLDFAKTGVVFSVMNPIEAAGALKIGCYNRVHPVLKVSISKKYIYLLWRKKYIIRAKSIHFFDTIRKFIGSYWV